MFDVEYYELPSGDKPVKNFLTNGFIKKTQKTPPSEIALARKFKADYEDKIKNE